MCNQSQVPVDELLLFCFICFLYPKNWQLVSNDNKISGKPKGIKKSYEALLK